MFTHSIGNHVKTFVKKNMWPILFMLAIFAGLVDQKIAVEKVRREMSQACSSASN